MACGGGGGAAEKAAPPALRLHTAAARGALSKVADAELAAAIRRRANWIFSVALAAAALLAVGAALIPPSPCSWSDDDTSFPR